MCPCPRHPLPPTHPPTTHGLPFLPYFASERVEEVLAVRWRRGAAGHASNLRPCVVNPGSLTATSLAAPPPPSQRAPRVVRRCRGGCVSDVRPASDVEWGRQVRAAEPRDGRGDQGRRVRKGLPSPPPLLWPAATRGEVKPFCPSRDRGLRRARMGCWCCVC